MAVFGGNNPDEKRFSGPLSSTLEVKAKVKAKMSVA
jgi:hypothetical protein